MIFINTDIVKITAEGLSKSFGAVLFKDISFSVFSGEALGITGGNGRGKTTLLNIVAGLEKPSSGSVWLSGNLGYVMQNDSLIPSLTVLDSLKMTAALNKLPRKTADLKIKEAIDFWELESFLKKRVFKCSMGMKRRLNIALAVLGSPEILLLDEAYSPLDAGGREKLRKYLEGFLSGGGAILTVAHEERELSGLCRRALNIETGGVCDYA